MAPENTPRVSSTRSRSELANLQLTDPSSITRSSRFAKSGGTPSNGSALANSRGKRKVVKLGSGSGSRSGSRLIDLSSCTRRSPRFVDNLAPGSALADSRKVRSSKKRVSDRSCSSEKQRPVKKARIGTGGGGGGSKSKEKEERHFPFFVGNPVPEEDARKRWPWRFPLMNGRKRLQNTEADDDDDKLILDVKCHYSQAEINKCVFYLGDCAYVKGEEGGHNYIGRILEFFRTMDDKDYFRVQWFFRAGDTVMKEAASSHNEKRVFYSTLMNDNLLDCIVSKVKIIQTPPRLKPKATSKKPCDFYYDMEYSVDYSSFTTMAADTSALSSSACREVLEVNDNTPHCKQLSTHQPEKSELALLDIYSGCGGMSTGLCYGFKLSGLNMVTKWAVDMDKSACSTLKLNHPETQIRYESASDFFDLLKEWDKLCKQYDISGSGKLPKSSPRVLRKDESDLNPPAEKIPSGEYEVASLVDICFGDPGNSGKPGLKFQVRWVGYGPSEDTWESVEELSNCQDKIKEFVCTGLKEKILPRPGEVDVICGGPPCQGISGYNRFRNVDSPMDDEKNRQLVVFMDIVNFLKPKYILMENVVDILKFAKASLGRYALSRLVQMKYQARMGIMAAGCYGLAQYRLRVFLWGAHPCEKLPQFPLPTHNVVCKYGSPTEFERNIVAFHEGQSRQGLEKALVLKDAISDLPPVTSHETRQEMTYDVPPNTEFQKYIRSTKSEMMCVSPISANTTQNSILYDHRPLPLSEEDNTRVSLIPHKKGANFRDLPGVIVGSDNVARRDPTAKPILMPSGRPLVPDYALNFGDGKSLRPFSRVWWDDVIPTVLCHPDAHSQGALHPEQDRVLTLRECARLQGFPDYFQFRGDLKDRYRQVGNAVAIPVARALGYALGLAVLKLGSDEPVMTLPPKFSHSTTVELLHSLSNKIDENDQTPADENRPMATDENYQTPADEFNPMPTDEIDPMSTDEIHETPTDEIHETPTEKIDRRPTDENHLTPIDEIHETPTDEIIPMPTEENHSTPTDDTYLVPTEEIDPRPTDENHLTPIDEIYETPTDEIIPMPTEENHSTPTDDTYLVPTEEIDPRPTDENHLTPIDEIYETPTDEVIPMPTDENHPTPTDDSYPVPTEEIDPRPTDENHLTPIDEIYETPTDEVIPMLTEENHPTPTDDTYPVPTEEIDPRPTDENHLTPIDEIYETPTDEVIPMRTEENHPTPTDDTYPVPTEEIDPRPTDKNHLTPIDEINETPTDEIIPTPTDDTYLVPTDEIYGTPANEIYGTPADEFDPMPTNENDQTRKDEIHGSLGDEIHPMPTDENHSTPTDENHQIPVAEYHSMPIDGNHQIPIDGKHQTPTDEIHPMLTDEQIPVDKYHQTPTDEIHPMPTDEIHPKPTNEIHQMRTDEIHPMPTNKNYQIPTDENHPTPTDEVPQMPTDEIHSYQSDEDSDKYHLFTF